MIKITIPGRPKTLQRHRDIKGTKFKYDPSKNDKQDFLAKCMANRPPVPIDGPIEVRTVFYFQRPKKHFRSNGELKPDAPIFYTNTPDTDNMLKFIGDALNGIFWQDDKLICDSSEKKRYDVVPRIELTITELTDHGQNGEQMDNDKTSKQIDDEPKMPHPDLDFMEDDDAEELERRELEEDE